MTKRIKKLFIAVCVLLPFIVLAQTTTNDPGAPTNVGIQYPIPWTQIVEGIFGLLTAFVTYLIARMKSNSDINTAQGQLLHLADVLQVKVWAALTPEVRAEVAKGNWRKVEAEVLKAVQDAAVQEVGQGFVTNLAKTLKLPMASMIGTVASFLINRYLNAHDPAVVTESANQYPLDPNLETGA